jgi:hypothetical protein
MNMRDMRLPGAFGVVDPLSIKRDFGVQGVRVRGKLGYAGTDVGFVIAKKIQTFAERRGPRFAQLRIPAHEPYRHIRGAQTLEEPYPGDVLGVVKPPSGPVARNRDEALAFVVPEGRRRKARFSSDLAYAHPFHGRELTS